MRVLIVAHRSGNIISVIDALDEVSLEDGSTLRYTKDTEAIRDWGPGEVRRAWVELDDAKLAEMFEHVELKGAFNAVASELRACSVCIHPMTKHSTDAFAGCLASVGIGWCPCLEVRT